MNFETKDFTTGMKIAVGFMVVVILWPYIYPIASAILSFGVIAVVTVLCLGAIGKLINNFTSKKEKDDGKSEPPHE